MNPSDFPAADFPAQWRVHWPGQEVDACDRHKQALEKIASNMGFLVSFSVAAPGAQCKNCINEAMEDD